MVKLYRHIIVLLLFTFTSVFLYAQQGLLQQVQLDDYYRRLQMTGADTTVTHSFFVQPYSYRFHDESFRIKKNPAIITAVIGYTLQNNSLLPYSYNDESLYPASGFQQRITAGIYFEMKHLAVKFQPEFILASNTVHDELIPPARSDLNNYWGGYFAMLANRIDMPSRFGDNSISKAYPGQSSIHYKAGGFSVGISTENLWWGPGRYNALIMSNNAPGFLHGTIQTNKPLKTPIGKIEMQVVYGELKGSGVTPPEFKRLDQLGCPQCYTPPLEDKPRKAAGYVVAIAPKGLDNLYVGMAYMSYFYQDTTLAPSALSSLFFRYVMPKDHAEIYAEYGRSDKFMSPFAIFGDSVPYGYTIGLRKMIPTRDKKSFISLAVELSHLGLPKASLIFDRNNIFGPPNPNAYSWYTSATIRHGYTNEGQVMGAAIGPGSNSQTLNVSWVREQNQIGVQFQRVMHNTDFYYYNYFNGIFGGGNTDAFWTDISASLFAQWRYQRFLFAGSVDYLSSLDYKWLKLDGAFGEPSSLSDKRNFQVRLSVLYSMDWRLTGISLWSHKRAK